METIIIVITCKRIRRMVWKINIAEQHIIIPCSSPARQLALTEPPTDDENYHGTHNQRVHVPTLGIYLHTVPAAACASKTMMEASSRLIEVDKWDNAERCTSSSNTNSNSSAVRSCDLEVERTTTTMSTNTTHNGKVAFSHPNRIKCHSLHSQIPPKFHIIYIKCKPARDP